MEVIHPTAKMVCTSLQAKFLSALLAPFCGRLEFTNLILAR
jgi:hypothetical protein